MSSSTVGAIKRGPHSPLGYLGARKARNQQKKFGIKKFYPKPKNQDEWHLVFLQHKIDTPQLEKIELRWSTKGPGQAGIRHFKYFSIPPIKYFNQNVQLEITKDDSKNFRPRIILEFENGDREEKEVYDASNEDICQWVSEKCSKRANKAEEMTEDQ